MRVRNLVSASWIPLLVVSRLDCSWAQRGGAGYITSGDGSKRRNCEQYPSVLLMVSSLTTSWRSSRQYRLPAPRSGRPIQDEEALGMISYMVLTRGRNQNEGAFLTELL